MKQTEAISFLKQLPGTQLKEVHWSGNDLNLGFHFTTKESSEAETEKKIFLVLKNCNEFYFQPLPNSALVFSEPEEIIKLKLKPVTAAIESGGKIKIPARSIDTAESGLLVFHCDFVMVLNENFDDLSKLLN